jgi:hypothetical protein
MGFLAGVKHKLLISREQLNHDAAIRTRDEIVALTEVFGNISVEKLNDLVARRYDYHLTEIEASNTDVEYPPPSPGFDGPPLLSQTHPLWSPSPSKKPSGDED